MIGVAVMCAWPGDDAGLLAGVVAHYRAALESSGSSSAVWGWLERRRISVPEVLGRLGVGFSDRSLGLVLPARVRGRGDDVRGHLQRLGVLRASGHEHFRGCVTFPVFDADGLVVQLYGRTVVDDGRLGAGAHRWLVSPRRGVWNLAGLIGGCGDVVVCGGIVDAVSFVCAGFERVVACDGPGGFDDELEAVLVEAGVGRVVIAFDADEAGDVGVREVAARLGGLGVSVARVELPCGLGVNDVAARSTQPAETLEGLVRGAVWVESTPAPPSRRSVSMLPSVSPSLSPPVGAVPSAESSAECGRVDGVTVVGDAAGVVGGEFRVGFDDRRWRVRGLGRVSSFEVLKLNVLVGRGDRFHVDSFDLYQARARAGFVVAAAAELRVGAAVLAADLGRVLLGCEAEAERVIRERQTPSVPVIEMSDVERSDALALLGDPGLVERIAEDVGRVGIVGETSNGLVAYLVAVSRLLDDPLAVVVQSSSAAGKSALVDAVLGFVPDEDVLRYSAVTGQSLFYMGGGDLAHKVLAVAEQEGASRASYALKLLQSDGRLSIASTGKDGVSGRLTTHTYEVVGPTAIFLTTTAIDIDEELLNRCLVVTVDESVAQTRAIHVRQRSNETLAGLIGARERERIVRLHQNAQRLLDPVAVVNPFAERLTFADSSARARRDHAKYLALIRAVTFLHQHQRRRRTVVVDGAEVVYVETELFDIEVANRVARDVLGRSLDDVPPQTRRLLSLVHDFVGGLPGARHEVRFSRRQLRDVLGWGDTQLKVHLARLVDLELVIAHRREHGAHLYELAWDGQGGDGTRFVIGLTDPAALTLDRSTTGQGAVGGRSAPGRPDNERSSPQLTDDTRPDPPRRRATRGAALGHAHGVIPASGERRGG